MRMRGLGRWVLQSVFSLVLSVCIVVVHGAEVVAGPGEQAQQILEASGVKGGLIVHVGCGNDQLTAALRVNESYFVHGLDTDAANIRQARESIHSLGLYGKVAVDRFDGKRLPYIDNLVNLLVSDDVGSVSMDEVMRVLCPNGVAYLRSNGTWSKTVKPRPGAIDEWTHYLHDASNNAVAHDTVVGPPRRMQWVGSPKWARHHDRMSSVSAVVSAGGRVFYIFDEGPRSSILMPPRWTVIARDAFNGTILWKRQIDRWHTHLWPLKSGPAQLPRRLVASGDRVFVTLSLDGPLVALDAATGQTVRMYESTKATEEIIFSNGILFLLVNKKAEAPEFANLARINRGYKGKFWDEAAREIVAVRAETGEVLWSDERRVLPATLAADDARVVFHDGERVVCLDRNTGSELWRSDPVARAEEIRSFYVPILVLYKDVVLFSGGETAGLQTGLWYTKGKDTLTALSVETGKELWTAYHPPSGYRSPEDLLVANGLVWTGETTSGKVVGLFKGRDPHTGEVKSEFTPDVETYWFHHRCYRGKATDNYLLMSRAGTEFVDVRTKHWIPHHWVRGACLYGVMPANGLLYAPHHPCACYLEAKLDGFNVLAPAASGPRVAEDASNSARLEKGPAYGIIIAAKPCEDDWPTYRHDASRSGSASTTVSPAIKRAWQAELGGRLTSPVIASKRVFVAAVETHQVHTFDAISGKRLWSYTAGGRIDSPPTIFRGRVLFGSADGWVYCLRASDGVLAWRFRAAPMDQRLMAFEQLESVWPVPGNVLVQDGVLYCVAGRSMFVDGGLHFWRLEPETGRVLSETVLDECEATTGKTLHEYVHWLNMPVALPDILSSDGRLVYMRSQPFHLDGTRLPLEPMTAGPGTGDRPPPAIQRSEYAHLFSPTGFVDDSWWHRTYWMYGSRFVSGWSGYYRAGKMAPSGRILVFDDSKVYGFGRKPQYYTWTTPIEHHLFAAEKVRAGWDEPATVSTKDCRVRVAESDSLNPAGKPLTVQAWVKSENPNGVVLAHGGSAQGYALYLRDGRAHFVVRSDEELRSVRAEEKIIGRWVHLVGILTADKKLRIYVDGQLAGSAQMPSLIKENPQQGMEIGADEKQAVGKYGSPFPFTGLIDEVRIYHRALSTDEIAKHAASGGQADVDTSDLVVSYSFDSGDMGDRSVATDASGHGNHGKVHGATVVQGKIGQALKFTGSIKQWVPFMVNHHWTKELPFFARAMVLAGGTLFIAGPADLVDEDQAFKQIDDPKVQSNLDDQAAVLQGQQRASLWAVSVADGEKLTEHALDASPVFDGMAAANGRLYVSTQAGNVLCLVGSGN